MWLAALSRFSDNNFCQGFELRNYYPKPTGLDLYQAKRALNLLIGFCF